MPVENLDALLAEALALTPLQIAPDAYLPLVSYAQLLLKWNATINLTAITDPREVVEKHLIDSLLPLSAIHSVERLLDLGAGGGLPGIPLALARPKLSVSMIDSVQKKVSFMKVAIATLHLGSRVTAIQQRLSGDPKAEQIALAPAVISRAFMDLERFVALGRNYLLPRGRLIAMVALPPTEAEGQRIGELYRCRLEGIEVFSLPFSNAPRAIVRYVDCST
jgi:16S rRNA (guanine527-N7)-methyltransferase